jgi:class 3 adenylate cyclase
VEAPTGTVTFLFTDIEGSTGPWESEPEAMRAALASHDLIIPNAIEQHGCYVFATGGAGFAAAFARAGDAAAAAAEAQLRSLRRCGRRAL